MSGNKVLIDSNIIIKMFQGNENVLDFLEGKELFISEISELEILSYPKITTSEENKIRNFFSKIRIISLDSYIKETVILLRKKYKTKLPDSIILATAYVMELPLFTGDKEFIKAQEDIKLFLLKN